MNKMNHQEKETYKKNQKYINKITKGAVKKDSVLSKIIKESENQGKVKSKINGE